MREFDELADATQFRSPGITRELYSQADGYMEAVHRKDVAAQAPPADLTPMLQEVFLHLVEGESGRDKVIVTKDNFLKELSKENTNFALKLKPVLSWVDKIAINGDNIELMFNVPADNGKGQPQWLREGRLAKDIATHGIFVPEVLRCRFSTHAGETALTGFKGLGISTTATGFPINIDRVNIQSIRLSEDGERLRFDVEAKNPAPFLSKFLPREKGRPDPISAVVFLDSKGNLEMRETWQKGR